MPADADPARHGRLRAGQRPAGCYLPSRNDEQLYAISNIDPFADASVLSRGIIAEHQDALWVASPLKKQRFRLSDGYCMEDETRSVAAWPVRVNAGQVEVCL